MLTLAGVPWFDGTAIYTQVDLKIEEGYQWHMTHTTRKVPYNIGTKTTEYYEPINIMQFVSLILPLIDFLNLFYAVKCTRTFQDPRRFLRWMSACCPPDVNLLTSYLPGEVSSVVSKPRSRGIWDEPEGSTAPTGKPVGRSRAPWADTVDDPTPTA
jgi:hypothetical protein